MLYLFIYYLFINLLIYLYNKNSIIYYLLFLYLLIKFIYVIFIYLLFIY